MKHIARSALSAALVSACLVSAAPAAETESPWFSVDPANWTESSGAWVSQVDDGSWTKAISTVWDSYRSGNNSASSAAQQQVNGSYRTFEILYVIAQILDN